MNFQKSFIEAYVEDLLSEWDIKYPGQLNMFRIADKLNIYLYLYDGRSRGIVDGDEIYIFLNVNLTVQELWQDFCHELGHILRHAGDQRKMHPLQRQLQEWQADSFMYELCVPTGMLRHMNLPMDMREASMWIAVAFNVTESFAYKRLNRYYQKTFYLKEVVHI